MLSNIFFRFWRILSLPFVAITFIVCYVTLPDSIAIHHTEYGMPDGYIDRQSFFYIVFAIVIAFNLLVNLLKNQALKVDYSKVNPKSVWANKPEALKTQIETWFDAFIAFINSYIAIVLIALNRINRAEGQRLDIDYNIIMLITAILLLILLFYLPIRLLYTNPKGDN